MSNPLFENSPVSAVVLPGSEKPLSLNGLIVVVGPNSSGKTNLLRDVHAAASGMARDFVVAKEIHLRPASPNLDDYLKHFQWTGDIEESPQGSNAYRKRGHQIGMQTGGVEQFTRVDIQEWFNQLASHVSKPLGGGPRQSEFLMKLGLLECAALFLQQRLALTDSAERFDTHQAPPKVALQALRLNQTAHDKFCEEILKVFRRGVWLDVSGGPTLSIKVSDNHQVPSLADRLMPNKVMSYRSIETEGEGIRSYAAVCLTLLLAQRSLYLIDEPEMCLHPPQARDIGRFIGEQRKTVKGCIMVSTHSSQVLRGIVETNPNTTVIRLTRSKGSFRGKQVSSEILRQATRKPFSRSEIIVDGLFSDAVVLCESDGDRVVYESALNKLPTPRPDIRFTPVGGVGGLAESARLYRSLDVPVAVSADIDLLFKGQLKDVLAALEAPVNRITDICDRSNQLVQQIRKVDPELTPQKAIEELDPLLKGAESWDLQKEGEIRSKLNKLVGRLNRLASLKSNGIDGVPPDHLNEAISLLEELKQFGLFLVPCGELESWVPELMKDSTSKVNKTLWASEAARKIEENERGSNDVWDYVDSIVMCIRSVLERN